jgi:hypothetical protein
MRRGGWRRSDQCPVIALASGAASELDGSHERCLDGSRIRSSAGEHRERTTVRRGLPIEIRHAPVAVSEFVGIDAHSVQHAQEQVR